MAIACCELLSFFSIFGIQNNPIVLTSTTSTVVNCFHFSVSLGYKTTKNGLTTLLISCELLSFFSIFGIQNNIQIISIIANGLWIAFIFQYLWDTKQQLSLCKLAESSCELLSFFSIFGIQNNSNVSLNRSAGVVNCFHFSVSLGYKTTKCHLHQNYN